MRRATVPLLAGAVAMVLADSAIVTLALPDILFHLDTGVGTVAWVLIAYNIVLGVAAVPAAWLLKAARPRVGAAIGIAAFALASAACALAGSIEMLIVARCAQALGGALALVGCLVLLGGVLGQQRGLALWITAGVAGTALGPVVGGLLTQAISWQSIFFVQVPFAILAVPAALAVGTAPAGPAPSGPDHGSQGAPRHRPAFAANLAQALLSAALTAALFLLVLLLVQGWKHPPALAALTVSVIALGALAGAPLVRAFAVPPRAEVAIGGFLISGGLVGLAIVPSSDLAWLVAPQVLVGLGLGMTVDRLTSLAMHAHLAPAEQPVHAAWTIAARHLGVVAGLALLTPVFTADLLEVQEPAQEAITAIVLDSPLPVDDKIAIARELGAELSAQSGEVPDLARAFDRLEVATEEQEATDLLEAALTEQVERAATLAFRDSFLIGAVLALLGMVAALLIRPRRAA